MLIGAGCRQGGWWGLNPRNAVEYNTNAENVVVKLPIKYGGVKLLIQN